MSILSLDNHTWNFLNSWRIPSVALMHRRSCIKTFDKDKRSLLQPSSRSRLEDDVSLSYVLVYKAWKEAMKPGDCQVLFVACEPSLNLSEITKTSVRLLSNFWFCSFLFQQAPVLFIVKYCKVYWENYCEIQILEVRNPDVRCQQSSKHRIVGEKETLSLWMLFTVHYRFLKNSSIGGLLCDKLWMAIGALPVSRNCGKVFCMNNFGINTDKIYLFLLPVGVEGNV